MILKGSQRGGAKQLAIHLQRSDENDHIELHEVRGFIANDLRGAFREAYAISKGTKCQQFLFSLSLSPPQTADVPVAEFEKAIGDIEAKLGLAGQPRVIVFHEKQGRRHAHCVWSRIDADAMKAIKLPHFKLKLRDVSRELFLEHGWHMPAGLANSKERDPRNFTREEWQQARRADRDASELKEAFQDCWAISDSQKAYAQALESRGLYLARGDRRGFVAIDVKGEVYSIPKWTGLKTKQVEARLGDPAELRSVEETKAHMADLLSGMLGRHLAEADQERVARRQPLISRKMALRERQRAERAELRDMQMRRADVEARRRAQHFRTGIVGLWDRLIGRHVQIRFENEADALNCLQRDDQQRQAMISVQLRERRKLHQEVNQVEQEHRVNIADIQQEVAETSRHKPSIPPLLVEATPSQRKGARRRQGPKP